jgi:GT2 family glycosyltransferase
MDTNIRDSISILIITYNRPDDTLDFLKSLQAQENASHILKEVLILDNASTESYESTHAFIKENPQLKINFIKSDENLGVARGRNKLMSVAKGDWLLVLDDDLVFSKNTDLEKIASLPYKEIFANSNTAVFAMRVVYYDTGDVQITAFPQKKYEEYKNKQQFFSSYYIGCAHLMKRSVLEQTGLYPADFFYGMEEYDLGYRILNTGATMAYDGEVTLRHKESPLGRQANYKKLQMQWINKSKVAWRYLPFICFFTTAIMWSFQYLKKAKGHLGTYILTWFKILAIPFSVKRTPLKKETINYLHKTEARLWY